MGQNTCFACLFPRCAEKSVVAARKIGNVFQPNVLSKQIVQQVHSFQGGNKPRLRVFSLLRHRDGTKVPRSRKGKMTTMQTKLITAVNGVDLTRLTETV